MQKSMRCSAAAKAEDASSSVAIVLLAGGEARRFPDKLERADEGEPLVVRTYRNVRDAGWPVYVAGRSSFSRAVDALLDAPLLVDRRPRRGPLYAFIWACALVRARRLFAVAADQPDVAAPLLWEIDAQWRVGDEAVVPCHGDRIEPLAAAYDRRAVLREASVLRGTGACAMHDLIDRLATRFVPANAHHFRNVNRPGDLMPRTG